MLFVFPRLFIDVVQFCSKFASCHFAEKAKLRLKVKVPLTENWTVGVISMSRLCGEGALHCVCPLALKTLVTPLWHC